MQEKLEKGYVDTSSYDVWRAEALPLFGAQLFASLWPIAVWLAGSKLHRAIRYEDRVVAQYEVAANVLWCLRPMMCKRLELNSQSVFDLCGLGAQERVYVMECVLAVLGTAFPTFAEHSARTSLKHLMSVIERVRAMLH